MSVGRLIVELELRDGQYTSRMHQAGQTAQTLSGHLGRLNGGMSGLERGLKGALPHLRDISIVGMAANSAFSGIANSVVPLAQSLMKANAQIEKTKVLLTGLSNAIDPDSRLKEASKDMEFLFQTAKQSPFALSELTNSFVKLKSAGLDNVEQTLTTLTDALSSFGGDDQALHRTTVALQQMASKGVISMEELRQQLGESLPTAMQSMADGMGLSMAELVKQVSTGRVKAVPAIRAMMQEMEFTMRGSSANMMKTWSGMTSQLETNWMLLQKKIGEAGLFEAAKAALSDLNMEMDSDEALKYASVIGKGLTDALSVARDLAKEFKENKDLIIAMGEGLLVFYAIRTSTKVAAALASSAASPGSLAAMTGSGSYIGAIGRQGGGFMNEARGYWTRPQTTITPANFAAGQINPSIQTSQVAITGFGNKTAAVMKTAALAVGALVSSWGLLAAAVGVAGYEYYKFSQRGREALNEVIRKQHELNDAKHTRVDGDEVLTTQVDIDGAKENLVKLKDELANFKDKVDKRNSIVGLFSDDTSSSSANKKYDEIIKKKTKEILDGEQATAEGQVKVTQQAVDRQKKLISEQLNETFVEKTKYYKAEREKIDELLEVDKKANRSKADTDKLRADLSKKLLMDQIQWTEEEYKRLIATVTASLDALQKDAGSRDFLNLRDSEDKLKEAITIAEVDLARLSLSLEEETRKGADAVKVQAVKTEVEKAKKYLEGLKKALGDTTLKMVEMQKQGIVDPKDVQDIDAARYKLELLTKGLKDYQERKAIRGGESLADYYMDGDNSATDKELEAAKGRAKSLKIKLAETVGKFAQEDGTLSYNKTLEKELIKQDGKASNELIVSLQASMDKREEIASLYFDIIEETKKGRKVEEISLTGESAKDFGIVTALGDARQGLIDDVGSSIEAIDKQNEAMAKTIGKLNEINGVREINVATTEREINAQNALNRSVQALEEGKPVYEIDSHQTTQLRMQIELQDRLNASRGLETDYVEESLRLELKRSEAVDKVEAQTKENKKKLTDDLEAAKKAEQDAKRSAEFILDVNRKANQELAASTLQLQGTREQIYEADKAAFAENLADKLRQHGETNQKIIDKEIETNKKKYEATKRLNEQLAQLEQKRVFDAEARMGAIRRAPGTSRNKDLNGLNESFTTSVGSAIEDNRRGGKSVEDLMASIDLLKAKRNESLKDFEYAHRNAFQVMMQEEVDFNQVAGDAGAMLVNGLADGMAMLAVEGTANFKEFAASVLKSISQMITRMLVLYAVQKLVQVAGSMAGGGMGDAGLYSSTTGLGVAGPNFGFANGGIMTSGGSVPLRKYANGGIAKRPQLALFGEGSMPEAYVPLPDGRSIPVSFKNINSRLDGLSDGVGVSSTLPDMSVSVMNMANALQNASIRINGLFAGAMSQQAGGAAPVAQQPSLFQPSSGGDNVSIVLNINESKSESKGDSGEKRSANDDGKMWDQFSKRIKGMIVEEMTVQKRPGGVLWR
jgi:tape measure domain-containing protein